MKGSKIKSAYREWLVNGLLAVSVLLLYKFVLKNNLIYVINQSLPNKEASLLRGMVLGYQDFDRQFYASLRNVGLVHLVVASGANVALISGMVIEKVAWVLGRKRAIVWGLFLIWGYASMVEWEAPIVRAVILVTIYYMAQIIGRKYSILRGLILAVAIMLAANLEYVRRVGFWLSIIAFGAIALRSESKENSNILIEDLKTTLWVSLWISPILAMVFGEFSLVGPLVNAFSLFLVQYVTVVGAVGALLGLIWPIGGRLVLMLSYPLLKYLVMVSEGVAGITGVVMKISFNWYFLVGWYMVLGGLLLKRRYENKNLAFI